MLGWTHGTPDHTFDLHGQRVDEAAANARRFLESERHAGARLVRLITGRGRSGGGAPIRTRVRTLLGSMKNEGRVVLDFILEETEGSFLVRLRN
jgi:DNA-nicking Smr family endonuclease